MKTDGQAYFSRLALKRGSEVVAPLIDILAPPDTGEAMSIGHRLMWTVMPDNIRQSRAQNQSAFLWRAAGDGRKYYLLGPKPVVGSPLFEIETKLFEPHFVAGDRLAFDLRVNATVDRKTGQVDGRAVRTRIDVAFDLMRTQEDKAGDDPINRRAKRRSAAAQSAIDEWLTTRSEQSGFRLIASNLIAYRTETLPRRGTSARIGVFDVNGILEVASPDAFLGRVLAGFGRAKAFGCGLMLLKRAHQQR
jgi:CRISPR system Cascade subunit CasE